MDLFNRKANRVLKSQVADLTAQLRSTFRDYDILKMEFQVRVKQVELDIKLQEQDKLNKLFTSIMNNRLGGC